MARLIVSIFLCGLFLTPLVASALEPVKGPEFKLQNSRERGNIYERNFQRRETIATYEMLDDFFSPETINWPLSTSTLTSSLVKPGNSPCNDHPASVSRT